MYDDFGIGATEVIVFLTIAAIVWALYALATIDQNAARELMNGEIDEYTNGCVD